ncbi:guanylyl cyclase-activating protein 2-like [Conger conger]|uniref:guanylyl cyclase-activating protein 2-like n=1 Tax=Conger conger TaxID=82655 RepID=UPI002A5A08A2|nr:guanylyl cyclase-activating protein 2-like [Conger conger]
MGQTQSDGEVQLGHIQRLYKKFVSECPSGNLHLHEFRRIFGVSAQSLTEESAYMDSVFHSFDTNEDDAIEFVEYVAAVHLVLRGKLEDRLKWSFKIYDHDGNGQLERHEVRRIIKIIYAIKKHSGQMEGDELSPDQVCNRIFELVDKNKDGHISLEEFMEGAQKDEWVLKQLKLDVRPSGWFIEQQKKNPYL